MASGKGLLDEPDDKVVLREKPLVATFKKGTPFVRVFNSAATYGKFDFNPSRASLTDPTQGNRFDGTNDDPFDVYYAATPDTATGVAFWETMQNHVEVKDLTYEQFIFKSKLAGRAFLYFTNKRELKLVDVRDHTGARRFLAKIKVLQGDNRLLTRAWASFIRRRTPKHHGLLYDAMMSRYERTVSGPPAFQKEGWAVVLMKPDCSSDFLQELAPHEPLSRGEGLLKVKQALRGTGVGLG